VIGDVSNMNGQGFFETTVDDSSSISAAFVKNAIQQDLDFKLWSHFNPNKPSPGKFSIRFFRSFCGLFNC